MIQTGSSGSYFIRACLTVHDQILPASSSPETVKAAVKQNRIKTLAVFKPNDEEPYGNLNPKRVFLRRYLWWAMGRPCLIPSFSYLSEVGASLLGDRLHLSLVPSTRLVELSSSAFSYTQKERQRGVFREKIGSYQKFLYGYVNASTLLRAHPWPSRPRDLLERDLQAENHAHGRARARAHKGKGATERSKQRGCALLWRQLNCCAFPLDDEELERGDSDDDNGAQESSGDQSGFFWTRELMQDFRLELEKLVCFDYLMRNTDRGLDNFMVKVEQVAISASHPSGWKLTLAAIDNSLAFPWKHPAGIRSYPWGWLYLPTDLIGGNFSPSTKQAFIPFLSNARWWDETRQELEKLFRKDDHFDEKKFQGQMEVLRGQGWNLLESLRSEEEGPLELCARQKQMVRQETRVVDQGDLSLLTGFRLPLTPAAQIIGSQLRTSSDTTFTPPSQPLPVKAREDNGAASSECDAIQPRSLPETIDEEQIAHRWHQASVIDGISLQRGHNSTATTRRQTSDDVREGEVIGKAYRGKSLGIDVLTEIDKRTSKSKRPGLRKAFTGHSSREVTGVKGKKISRREPTSVLSERDEDNSLEDSFASLPGPTPPPAFLKTRRRRNGSVGDNWSISSVLDRRSGNECQEEEDPRIKVIIEVGAQVAALTCISYSYFPYLLLSDSKQMTVWPGKRGWVCSRLSHCTASVRSRYPPPPFPRS